jgi:hypothetical protein
VIPLPGGSQFLQGERALRFPTEKLQISDYEFNDDAPEPNTVDTKSYTKLMKTEMIKPLQNVLERELNRKH